MFMATGKEKHPRSFGHILWVMRIKSNMSRHQVASHVGSDKETVKQWEENDLTPGALQLKRLYTLFPRLKYFNDYLPKLLKDQLVKRAYAAGEAGKSLWVPPSPTPEDMPVPQNIAKISFGEALRVSLKDENIHPRDILDLLEVSDEEIIHLWESDKVLPTVEQYEKLLIIFPQLEKSPKPGERDTTEPPIVSTVPYQGAVLRLPIPTRALPPSASPPPKSLPTIKQNKPPPPPSTPVPAKTPKRTSVEAAGIKLANSRLALEHARTYLEDLRAEIPKIEAEIEKLSKDVEDADKRLMEAIKNLSDVT